MKLIELYNIFHELSKLDDQLEEVYKYCEANLREHESMYFPTLQSWNQQQLSKNILGVRDAGAAELAALLLHPDETVRLWAQRRKRSEQLRAQLLFPE